MINGSNVVGTRELGSNITSTTIGTTTSKLTDGTGKTISHLMGLVHQYAMIVVLFMIICGFVGANTLTIKCINHCTGLNGGGTIISTRTLNVDDDYKNTSLNSLAGSLVTKAGSETLQIKH